jgi:hypothetical protein
MIDWYTRDLPTAEKAEGLLAAPIALGKLYDLLRLVQHGSSSSQVLHFQLHR